MLNYRRLGERVFEGPVKDKWGLFSPWEILDMWSFSNGFESLIWECFAF